MEIIYLNLHCTVLRARVRVCNAPCINIHFMLLLGKEKHPLQSCIKAITVLYFT